MWEHCLTTLENDPLKLDREVDWVIKHNLIEAYREKHDLPLAIPKVALLDLQYHDVNRDRGLFYQMQARDLVERMCTDEDIDTAVDEPAADHPGPAARRVHPPGQGAQARLHGRLGAPEAQRPGPAHGAVQGPVQVSRRAGREADRVVVTTVTTQPKDYADDPARFAAARAVATRWSVVGDIHPVVAARIVRERLQPVVDVGCGDGALRQALPVEWPWVGLDEEANLAASCGAPRGAG